MGRHGLSRAAGRKFQRDRFSASNRGSVVSFDRRIAPTFSMLKTVCNSRTWPVILEFRSPWSNKYDPSLDDGNVPSERLRKLEVDANAAFDQYRDMYFEGGVSSVYLWDLDQGFAGVILIKKTGDGSKKIKGCWDSIHVVEVQEKSGGRNAHYKLTSTAMLWLQTDKPASGTMNLGGSLTRQVPYLQRKSECFYTRRSIGVVSSRASQSNGAVFLVQ